MQSKQSMKYMREDDELKSDATGGQVDSSPLVGTWINTDKATGGIAKLILSKKGDSFFVQAFGACAPSPRDWGKVEGEVFSSAVDSREGMAFTARFDFGFMETSLAVYLKSGILVLDSFNTFKDGSSRSNYFSREFYYQQ
ncbi:MAG: hypothetical protein AB1631_15860 [Acidobacteriota bacterium]